MTAEDLMTTEFALDVNGTAYTVSKLSVIGETRLFKELGRRLHASYGPGGYLANIRSALTWLESQKMHAAYQQLVSDAGRLEMVKAVPGIDAIDEYRQTPDGLACELFLRTRKTHPDLAEPVIRSQLNELNAWQICVELWEGLAADHKRRPADPDGDPATGQ